MNRKRRTKGMELSNKAVCVCVCVCVYACARVCMIKKEKRGDGWVGRQRGSIDCLAKGRGQRKYVSKSLCTDPM